MISMDDMGFKAFKPAYAVANLYPRGGNIKAIFETTTVDFYHFSLRQVLYGTQCNVLSGE